MKKNNKNQKLKFKHWKQNWKLTNKHSKLKKVNTNAKRKPTRNNYRKWKDNQEGKEEVVSGTVNKHFKVNRKVLQTISKNNSLSKDNFPGGSTKSS